MPPSPRLSARRIKSAYLIEMIRIGAHRISDTTPRTASFVSGPPWVARLGRFLQGVEGAGADVAVDDTRAPSVAAAEATGMAGGCNWRDRSLAPPLAIAPAGSAEGRDQAASVRRDAANCHGVPLSRSLFAARCRR